MLQRFFYLLITLFFVIGCSSEDNSGTDDDDPGNDEFVLVLSISENQVVGSESVLISSPQSNQITQITVFIDDVQIDVLNAAPFSFNIPALDFNEGRHELRIVVLNGPVVLSERTIDIRIDNSGPVLSLNNPEALIAICTESTIAPQVIDGLSGVRNIEVLYGDEPVAQSDEGSFQFTINPDDFSAGTDYLKFIMEDIAGNISMDSIPLGIGKTVLDIHFPDKFFDTSNSQSMYVLLSDEQGNLVDYQSYSSGQAETLSFCSTLEDSPLTEYILTFATKSNDQFYDFVSYSNLKLSALGGQITMAQRTLPTSTRFPRVDLPFYQSGYDVRSRSIWSSIIWLENIFQGHFTHQVTDQSLGIDKAYIQYFNPSISRSYKYAFIDEIYNRQSLDEQEFTDQNVVHGNLQFIGGNQNTFLAIYGYDNEAKYHVMNGHQVFWYPGLNSLLGNEYGYADIFDYLVYSAKVSNYAQEGVGAPPTSITVPGTTIDYSYNNGQFLFTGLPDYEVGRAEFNNNDDENITVQLIFDGQASEVIFPKLPEELFSTNILDVFENGRLNMRQATSENYSTFSSYDEYVSEVVAPSVPFYVKSPLRQRVFKSSVSTQLLPIREFPHFGRF